jgi:hypothetical protein
MTYQDLIEELQGYSPEELQKDVTFLFSDGIEEIGFKCDDELSASDVDSLTCISYFDCQIFIMV